MEVFGNVSTKRLSMPHDQQMARYLQRFEHQQQSQAWAKMQVSVGLWMRMYGYSSLRTNAKARESSKNTYSTVGCRRTGGRRSQPGSFLFFATSANLVLILQSVFESRRLACSAQTVCDDACWAWNAAETFQTVEVEAFEVRAMLPKKSSSQQTLFACGEPFLAHFSSLGRSYF